MRLVRIAASRGVLRSNFHAATKKCGPGPTKIGAKESYPGAPCWSCEKVFDEKNSLFCNGCNKLQPLAKVETYFELFDVPVSLLLDSKVLERKFQSLQRQVHPDMYATKTEQEQQIAIGRSSAVSEAYQTLKDPLLRAKYFLRMRGVDLESQVIEDKQLLMEIMDEQELLMELEPKARMERVAELDAKVLSCLSEAQTLLNHHGDAALMPVTQLIVKANYYHKLATDVNSLTTG